MLWAHIDLDIWNSDSFRHGNRQIQILSFSLELGFYIIDVLCIFIYTATGIIDIVCYL